MDIDRLNQYDPQRMYKVYDKWGEIAKTSYNQNLDSVDFRFINHIVFAGMGGSGAIGDLFSAILSKENVHVSAVKGYLLPSIVDSKSLIVTTSISGNTTETLSVLETAKEKSCKIIAFSSGGKMQQYCEKNNLEHRKISQIHSPRASFTAFLYSMLKVLEPVIPIKKNDVDDSIDQLNNLASKINSSNQTKTNLSLSLAEWINGLPVIYYPWGFQAAATRFKNCLQENAKFHAFAEDVIEACHNGIVSWEKSSNAQPILIQGQDDYEKTKERWEILKEYFEESGIDYRTVYSVKGSILSKLINLIYLLDYTTIYLAVLNNVDPSPIRSIDFIKSKL